MTPAGWVFMACSLGFVLALVGFCFYRVFATPATTEHLHAPLDIDPQDRET